ncbi:hypothetical protein OROMI_034676 [Orobanche minor]
MKPSLFISATLSLSLFCICHANMIPDLCSKSLYKTFCINTLRQSRCSQLKCMGQFIFSRAITATTDVKKTVPKQGDKKDAYVDCVTLIDNATSDLKKGSDELNAYGASKTVGNDINTAASAAMTDLETCLDGYKRAENLKTAITNAKNFLDVLLVISNNM